MKPVTRVKVSYDAYRALLSSIITFEYVPSVYHIDKLFFVDSPPCELVRYQCAACFCDLKCVGCTESDCWSNNLFSNDLHYRDGVVGRCNAVFCTKCAALGVVNQEVKDVAINLVNKGVPVLDLMLQLSILAHVYRYGYMYLKRPYDDRSEEWFKSQNIPILPHDTSIVKRVGDIIDVSSPKYRDNRFNNSIYIEKKEIPKVVEKTTVPLTVMPSSSVSTKDVVVEDFKGVDVFDGNAKGASLVATNKIDETNKENLPVQKRINLSLNPYYIDDLTCILKKDDLRKRYDSLLNSNVIEVGFVISLHLTKLVGNKNVRVMLYDDDNNLVSSSNKIIQNVFNRLKLSFKVTMKYGKVYNEMLPYKLCVLGLGPCVKEIVMSSYEIRNAQGDSMFSVVRGMTLLQFLVNYVGDRLLVADEDPIIDEIFDRSYIDVGNASTRNRRIKYQKMCSLLGINYLLGESCYTYNELSMIGGFVDSITGSLCVGSIRYKITKQGTYVVNREDPYTCMLYDKYIEPDLVIHKSNDLDVVGVSCDYVRNEELVSAVELPSCDIGDKLSERLDEMILMNTTIKLNRSYKLKDLKTDTIKQIELDIGKTEIPDLICDVGGEYRDDEVGYRVYPDSDDYSFYIDRNKEIRCAGCLARIRVVGYRCRCSELYGVETNYEEILAYCAAQGVFD